MRRQLCSCGHARLCAGCASAPCCLLHLRIARAAATPAQRLPVPQPTAAQHATAGHGCRQSSHALLRACSMTAIAASAGSLHTICRKKPPAAAAVAIAPAPPAECASGARGPGAALNATCAPLRHDHHNNETRRSQMDGCTQIMSTHEKQGSEFARKYDTARHSGPPMHPRLYMLCHHTRACTAAQSRQLRHQALLAARADVLHVANAAPLEAAAAHARLRAAERWADRPARRAAQLARREAPPRQHLGQVERGACAHVRWRQRQRQQPVKSAQRLAPSALPPAAPTHLLGRARRRCRCQT